jgi:hypothetical protein
VQETAIKLHERRRLALVVALVVFSVGCCVYSALSAPLGGDYPGPTCRTCDYAGPPIEALATGHVGRFFATQPAMGSFSLLLRAPVVAVARSLHSGELTQYRLGSLICLLAAAALAWVVVARMRPRGKQWMLVAVALGLLFAGPLTTKALWWGHPEVLLGALLCVVAVVFASRGQIVLAGGALGLALATNQWALLAILPAVIACPRQRTRLLTVTAGVAALFVAPMLIGDAGRFLAQNIQAGIGPTHANTFGVTPANIWYGYSRVGGAILGSGGGSTHVIPAALAAVAHALILVLGVGLPLVYWRWTRRRSSGDLLILLALVFMIRCLLDPLNISYHQLPFFVAIVGYETLRRRGLPIISIYSAGAFWALASLQNAGTLNVLYLAWAVPVTAYLGYRAFTGRSTDAVATRPRGKATAGAIAPQVT